MSLIASIWGALLLGPPVHGAGGAPEPGIDPMEGVRIADRKRARRARARSRNHSGLVIGVDGGVNQCRGRVCSTTHTVRPSVGFSAFLGGNFNGFVEIGVRGGYGRFDAEFPEGATLLRIFDADTEEVRAEAAEAGIDTDLLGVRSLRLWTAHAGPGLRVHLAPRGPVTAYVGSGVQYRLFRSDYGTAVGNVGIGFHGLGVPAEGGLGVYLTDKIALVGTFAYTFAFYGAVNVDHPQAQLVAPLGLVDTLLEGQSLKDSLPDYWDAAIGFRFVLDRRDPR